MSVRPGCAGRASSVVLVATLAVMLVGLDGVLAQRFGRPQQSFPGQQRPPPMGGGGYPSYGEAEDVLGAPCEYDEHCYAMEHTFCRNHKSCECKRGFIPSPAGDRCLATVGVSCSTKYDCSGLGQAGDCLQHVCDCVGSYVPSPDGSCVRGALKMNDACEEDLQCQTLGDGVVCLEGQCQCPPGRRKHPHKDACVTIVPLRGACNENADCFIGKEYEGIVTCYPGTGTCRCMEHYEEDAYGKCIAGASRTKAALILTLLVSFFVQFLR